MSKNASLPSLAKAQTQKLIKTSKTLKINNIRRSLKNSPKDSQTSFFLNSSRDLPKHSQGESCPSGLIKPHKLDFVHTYRNRIKIADRNSFQRLESSPSVAYLEMVDKNKLKPVAFGIFRNSGKETDLVIPGYSMGDNYAQAFSEGVRKCKSLEKINLKSNRLSEKGLTSIIGKLEIGNIKHLCLSENLISFRVISQISDILLDSKCNLMHLILESTKLSDSSANLIFESLALNSSIKLLNLARNSLTDECCKTLKSMLNLNSSLKKLDLHWNQFTGQGCAMIFEGLLENYILRELDLSWNLMSRDIEGTSIKSIAECVKRIKGLRHVDFSSNYLGMESCEILAKGFEQNHRVLGLHMLGNDCKVDSRGFIKPDIYVNKVEQGHVRNRMFSIRKSKPVSINNCWVCEPWVETKFIWTGEVSEPICIHLECDNFQPDLLSKDGEHYSITRVVPAGKVRFFFSLNLVMIKAKDFKVVKVNPPLKKEIEFWNSVIVTVYLNNLNQIETTGKVYNTKDLFGTEPRIPGKVFAPEANPLEKIPWKFSTSIFKSYKRDDESVLNDCFEFDWQHSRIQGIIKKSQDLTQFKTVLFKYYEHIKEAYKVLASYSGSELPCIGANILTELLNQCFVFDEYYKASDFGVNWSTVLGKINKIQAYNPGNALVRHEFMEILVRIAHDKYLRNKISFSLTEAMQRLMQDHLMPKFAKYSVNCWRENEYFCEIVDVTLKAHKIILESLYEKYSGRNSLPGQKIFMSLGEFREICNEGGLINDKFANREIDLCYYNSIMTQVDELNNKRHSEMRFIEFIEAITRVSSISSTGSEIRDELKLPPKPLTLQEKLENTFQRLIKLCPLQVQENFVFPSSKTYEKLMYKEKNVLYRSTTLNLLDVSY